MNRTVRTAPDLWKSPVWAGCCYYGCHHFQLQSNLWQPALEAVLGSGQPPPCDLGPTEGLIYRAPSPGSSEQGFSLPNLCCA